MNTISVNFYAMPRNFSNINNFFKSLKLTKETMVFVTRNCYEYIKTNSMFIGEDTFQSTGKTFMLHDGITDARIYLSLISISSGNLFYLEKIFSKKIHHECMKVLPKKVIFITLEGETSKDIPKIVFLMPPHCDCPVDSIIAQSFNFSNSIVVLTDDAYQRLIRNTSLISNYSNNYRLSWESDDYYPGGIIHLKSFNSNLNFFIEDMDFSFFKNKFDIQDFPNAIYFII